MPNTCQVLGVTPIPNIFNGDELVYPPYMYNGFEKFRTVTNEFKKITDNDVVTLFTSGRNSYPSSNRDFLKSIDFSENMLYCKSSIFRSMTRRVSASSPGFQLPDA